MEKIIIALRDFDYDTVELLIQQLNTTPIETFATTSLGILLTCDDESFPYVTELLEFINPYDNLHILNIVATFTLNREIVEYTKRYMEDLSHLEFITQWVEYSGGYFDNVGMVCDIYMSVYGPLSSTVMKSLLDDILKRDKYDFYNAMFGFYTRTSDYAPTPNWIDQRMTTDKELEENMELLGKIDPVDDRILAKDLYQYVEEGQEDLLKIISGLDDNKKDSLKSLIYGQDENLTSFFGPSNPYPPFLHDPKQERMFLCTMYLDEDDETWFDGSCDECGNRIRKEHHCLRMPLETGGWDGCFCSWKCLENRATENEMDLIVKIKDDIQKSLIYDR